jgi:hypothetical protein
MTDWCPHLREIRREIGDQLLPELAGLSMGYLEPEPFETKYRPYEALTWTLIEENTHRLNRVAKYAFGKAVFCPWCESGIHVLGRPDICIRRDQQTVDAFRFSDKTLLGFQSSEWTMFCLLPRDAVLPPDVRVRHEFGYGHRKLFRWDAE